MLHIPLSVITTGPVPGLLVISDQQLVEYITQQSQIKIKLDTVRKVFEWATQNMLGDARELFFEDFELTHIEKWGELYTQIQVSTVSIYLLAIQKEGCDTWQILRYEYKS